LPIRLKNMLDEGIKISILNVGVIYIFMDVIY